MPTPSVGRIVTYYSHGSADGRYPGMAARAAIITDVPTAGDVVSLCVINPTGVFFDQVCPYSETPKAGHWSWPTLI